MIVYLLLNTKTEKYSIGWTKQTLEQRWHDHCFNARSGQLWHLSNAIRRDGEEAFLRNVITIVNTEKEAKDLEKLWIAALNSFDPLIGYNMTHGGDGICWELLSNDRKKQIIDKRIQSLRIRAKNPTQAMLDKAAKISATHKARGICPKVIKTKGMTDVQFYGKERAMEISAKISSTIYGVRKGVRITNGKQNKVVLGNLYPEGWYRGRTQKGYKEREPDSNETRLSKSIAQKLRRKKNLDLSLLLSQVTSVRDVKYL